MACDLTLGRLEPCKDSVGGIESLTFLNYQEYVVTEAAGVITAMTDNDGTTPPTGYRYICRGATNSLTQNINTSRDNGTTFIQQDIAATFKKMSAASNEEFMLMIYGRPLVIVEDYNGTRWMCGVEWGCDVTGGTAVTGAAMGDLNGYTLTLSGMERKFAPQLDDTTYATFTIVEGI